MNISINQLVEYPKQGVISKQILKNEKQDTTLFCMAAGTEIDEHTSTKQGTVFVLEGRGIFNLAGEKTKMMPGVFIFMPKNAVHSLKAEENTSFLLNLVR